MHEQVTPSLLSESSKDIELRGLVNLLVLILLSYTVRAMIENYNAYGFRVTNEID